MIARAETAAAVRDTLVALWPGRFDGVGLADDLPLGDGGLGLDSIDIVELLIRCEDRLGLSGNPADAALLSEEVTLGRLVDHLTAA